MQVKHTKSSETEALVTVVAGQTEIDQIKTAVLSKMAEDLKITGFRQGKAPLPLVEKSVDQTILQSQFLEEAINQLYVQSIKSEKLRPVGNPEISVKKFVPFSTLEFEAKVPVVGSVTLPDYKKIKMTIPEVSIVADDVNEVLISLQKRMAEKVDVNRPAKDTDQVWIDFTGVNDKKEPIKGADGKDYPLVLGSDTFIPGFEKNLVGMSADDIKTFTLTFPKDYGVKALANKKVTFTVTVTKVQEVVEPKLDDDFAAKSGPFKTLKELKTDIKRQLSLERQQQTQRDFESDLVRKITSQSKISVPQVLIDEQVDRMLSDFKQNLVYRGQTYQEFLDGQGLTEEEFTKKEISSQAEERVKASLVLTEISEVENLDVSLEELESRIAQLKSQYKDDAMRAELDKPENRNDIASRILTDKTVELLVSYATK